jgi:pilus assembly protein Flp/PilA
MLEIVEYLKARMSTNERGAAAVEYALLVSLIAVAIIFAVTGLGKQIASTFTSVTKSV